jgi:hypothetical protein
MTNGWSPVRQQAWESPATSAAFMHLCLCTSLGCSGSPHWPHSPQSVLPCPTHDVSPSMRPVSSLAAVVASIHRPCGSSEDIALRRDSSITGLGLWPSHQLRGWPWLAMAVQVCLAMLFQCLAAVSPSVAVLQCGCICSAIIAGFQGGSIRLFPSSSAAECSCRS